MHRFRCRRDDDGVDIVALEKLAVIGAGGAWLRFMGDFREPLGPRLYDVQVFHERVRRGGFGAYSAAPAGAYDAHVDLFHSNSSGWLTIEADPRLCGRGSLIGRMVTRPDNG
jgi:hypothetical protein